MVEAMAAITEPAERTGRGGELAARRPSARSGPDRLTVFLLSLSAVLVVMAVLAVQLRASSTPTSSRRVIVLRRVYRTTVVETIAGQGSGTSVSQSVSSSGGGYPGSTLPTTRSSSHP